MLPGVHTDAHVGDHAFRAFALAVPIFRGHQHDQRGGLPVRFLPLGAGSFVMSVKFGRTSAPRRS